MKVYYHVTPTINVTAILIAGLIPNVGERSSECGEGEPRVYLFKTHDDIEQAMYNNFGESLGDESLTLLRIALPDTFNVRQDDGGLFEYYTTDTIPPKFITVDKSLLL